VNHPVFKGFYLHIGITEMSHSDGSLNNIDQSDHFSNYPNVVYDPKMTWQSVDIREFNQDTEQQCLRLSAMLKNYGLDSKVSLVDPPGFEVSSSRDLKRQKKTSAVEQTTTKKPVEQESTEEIFEISDDEEVSEKPSAAAQDVRPTTKNKTFRMPSMFDLDEYLESRGINIT